MSDTEKQLAILGVGLKIAIKTELDCVSDLVQAQNNVKAMTAAIVALGGDAQALIKDAKTPRRSKAMTDAAESAAAAHPDAIDGAAEAAPAESEAEPAAEESSEDEEERKVLMAEVRALATEFTSADVGGTKDAIKAVLKKKNAAKFADLSNKDLKGFQGYIKKQIDKLKAEKAAESEGEADDEWE